MGMKEITYMPIFNQTAPNIWDDFLHINVAATEADYKCVVSNAAKQFQMDKFRDSWENSTFGFAFAAYDGADMVGYVNGDYKSGQSVIQGLYVLPEYQSQKIGRVLLQRAENANKLFASSMGLVALRYAEKFYERNGYSTLYPKTSDALTEYIKKFSSIPQCATVPVFKMLPKISGVCRDIAKQTGVPFDARAINKDHSSAFVYVDVHKKIQGFATVDNNGKQNIAVLPGPMNDLARRSMARALAELQVRGR